MWQKSGALFLDLSLISCDNEQMTLTPWTFHASLVNWEHLLFHGMVVRIILEWEGTQKGTSYSLVQFSHSVVSDSLWPHEPQHARHPCPSPTLGVYTNSCPLSWWCHPTISSSVIPFSHLQSFQHQGLFKWVSSLHQVAKVLEFQLQHQFFQWIFRTHFL